jgi:hypothetical protein
MEEENKTKTINKTRRINETLKIRKASLESNKLLSL